jgi:anti-anti-sigma factor
VTFADSICTRILVSARRDQRRLGGSLFVVNPSTPVRRVFELVGLDGDLLDGTTGPDEV